MASSIKSRASAGGDSSDRSPRAWGPQPPGGPVARTAAPRRPAARTTRYLEPRLERTSRAEMTRLQTRRLREQVSHAAARSPFYRGKLKAAGVRAAAVRTLDDLRELPFTTKDELKENQAAKPPWGDLLAVPLDDVLRIHMTSATTGRPLAFLDTKDDWYGFYHSYARALHAFGVRRSDLGMAATRAKIETAFGAKAYDLPGLTEIAAWGFECDARSGLTHVNEDYCYPEVLDEQDRPVRPGERGELVFTSLYRKAMPLLRYRTRDVVQVADRRCPCGRTLVAFEGGVLARLDDMKKIRGGVVYPRPGGELVRPHNDVGEVQIVFRRHEGLDDLLIRIHPSPSPSPRD